MSNIETTIANIAAQLVARAWTIDEKLMDDGSPDNCHLVCTGPEGERRA